MFRIVGNIFNEFSRQGSAFINARNFMYSAEKEVKAMLD